MALGMTNADIYCNNRAKIHSKALIINLLNLMNLFWKAGQVQGPGFKKTARGPAEFNYLNF